MGQEKMLFNEKVSEESALYGMLQKKVLLIEMLQEGIFKGQRPETQFLPAQCLQQAI